MDKALLYYLPGGTGKPSLERIEAAGLGLSVGGRDLAYRGVENKGPDANRGVIIVPHGPSGPGEVEIGYHPDRQTWFQWDKGKAWVGFKTGEAPGPEDMARQRLIPGHDILMRDGNTWHMPAVRLYGGGTGVSQGAGIDSKGELILEDLPQFAEVCKGASWFWDLWTGESKTGEYSYLEAMRVASNGFALNYHVSLAEVSALHLFTTDNIPLCLGAMIDAPAYEEAIRAMNDASKKNEDVNNSDGSSSDSGETDGSPDTDQPTAT